MKAKIFKAFQSCHDICPYLSYNFDNKYLFLSFNCFQEKCGELSSDSPCICISHVIFISIANSFSILSVLAQVTWKVYKSGSYSPL